MSNFLLLEKALENLPSLLSTGLHQSYSQSLYQPLVTLQQGVFFFNEVYPLCLWNFNKEHFLCKIWVSFSFIFSFPKANLGFHFIYFFTNKGHYGLIFWNFHVILPQIIFLSHPSQPPGTSPVTKVSLTVHKHSLMSKRLCLSLLLLFSQPKIFKTTFSNIFIILWEPVSSVY